MEGTEVNLTRRELDLVTLLPLVVEYCYLAAPPHTPLGRARPEEYDPTRRPIEPEPLDPRTPAEFARIRRYAWEQKRRGDDARYDLRRVIALLDALARRYPRQAQAVWYEWVELQAWWVPEHRRRWAEAGVKWMALQWPGEIPRCQAHANLAGERCIPRFTPDERDAKICELSEDPYRWSQKRVAKHVGCSESTVWALLNGKVVRRGRAIAAGS